MSGILFWVNKIVLERPARDARDVLPIGNGDIGINARVEANGELILLIEKTDAWGEYGRYRNKNELNRQKYL